MSLKFNDFITNDIHEKTVIIGLLPKNTTNRQKEYNRIIDETIYDYQVYKESIIKFINYKFNKLMPKEDAEIQIVDQSKTLNEYLEIIKCGNPKTTYLEKTGLDMLLYDLTHYYNLSIYEINKSIIEIIKRFEEINVMLRAKDFMVNPFVYIYMNYLFNDMKNYQNNAEKNKLYEQIYWKCSSIFDYIFVIFSNLIEKNKRKFDKYVNKKYLNLLRINKFKSYYDVVNAIKAIYKKQFEEKVLTEYSYIKDVINGKIDADYYTKDNQNRLNDLKSLLINDDVINNELGLNKTYAELVEFKNNMLEYSNYLDLEDLIQVFYKKYKDIIMSEDKKKENKKTDKINYSNLWKIKYSNYYDKIDDLIYNTHSDEREKLTKQNLVLIDLCKKIKEEENIYFDNMVKNNLRINTTIGSLLEIITSFPYFTRKIIKDVYQYDTNTKEQDTDKILNSIHNLTFNPYRKLIDTIPLFVEKNMPQVLMNSYRFENIDVNMDSFEKNSITINVNKIEKLLLIKYIQNFKLKEDEIIFLKQVNLLKQKEDF